MEIHTGAYLNGFWWHTAGYCSQLRYLSVTWLSAAALFSVPPVPQKSSATWRGLVMRLLRAQLRGCQVEIWLFPLWNSMVR